ncbi:MAG: phosphate--acyl-ACP acyltransferase, partial [Deltaproteobacteria bacterium]|nr:phosphate--acyl-ACP acyltransferase [Deltaproteobacteria bacterium]
MNVAVDAMGGDYAPQAVVEGAVMAVRESKYEVTLVGDELRIKKELAGKSYPDRLSIHHAGEVVEMSEAPAAAIKKKKDSSIRVAFELVKQGRAQAVVSAGHSGATMAAGVIILGRLPGVERPALCVQMPSAKGQTVFIDVGANVDCRPSHLLQFAIMAEAFAKGVLHVENPSVGLLSIGEEDTKGNELVLAAGELLRNS